MASRRQSGSTGSTSSRRKKSIVSQSASDRPCSGSSTEVSPAREGEVVSTHVLLSSSSLDDWGIDETLLWAAVEKLTSLVVDGGPRESVSAAALLLQMDIEADRRRRLDAGKPTEITGDADTLAIAADRLLGEVEDYLGLAGRASNLTAHARTEPSAVKQLGD